MDEIAKKLQAPFAPQDVEWRVGSTNQDKSKGMALAYVTNRAIQDRLDDLFGPAGWRNEFREWKKESQLCGISIKFGDEWITKWDGADDSNMEATKGGLSDAMKRAAYQWGIGRYLYKLPDVWVPLKSGKYLEYEPELPAWALPEGYKGKNGTKPQGTTEPAHKAEEPTRNAQSKTTIPKMNCSDCGLPISEAEHGYSAKKFGRPLCRTCQKAAQQSA